MNTAKLHETASQMIEKFDLEKVLKMMKAVDWKWIVVGSYDEHQFPTILQMEETIYRLFHELNNEIDDYPGLKEGQFLSMCKGGFKVTTDRKRSFFSLEFVAEEQNKEIELNLN
jgi:hypothetical protein